MGEGREDVLLDDPSPRQFGQCNWGEEAGFAGLGARAGRAHPGPLAQEEELVEIARVRFVGLFGLVANLIEAPRHGPDPGLLDKLLLDILGRGSADIGKATLQRPKAVA